MPGAADIDAIRRRSRYNTILQAAARARRDDQEMKQTLNHDVSTHQGRQPKARQRTGQEVIQDRIKDFILRQQLDSGDPMPTEAELMEALGVSRNSLREALKALQAVGIIETRHGFGTYVGDCSLDPFADALAFRGRKSMRGDRHELREIVELRQALEMGLVMQVVDSIDDDKLHRLHQRLVALEADAGNGEAGDAADRAFHDELYSTLGNELIGQLIHVFWDVYDSLSDRLPPVSDDKNDIIAVHRAIYDAVAQRDPVAASAAIVRHFAGIRQRIEI